MIPEYVDIIIMLQFVSLKTITQIYMPFQFPERQALSLFFEIGIDYISINCCW